MMYLLEMNQCAIMNEFCHVNNNHDDSNKGVAPDVKNNEDDISEEVSSHNIINTASSNRNSPLATRLEDNKGVQQQQRKNIAFTIAIMNVILISLAAVAFHNVWNGRLD